MEEKKYAIYSISARWDQDDYENNSTGFSIMFKEDPGRSGVNQFAIDWWDKYINGGRKHDDIPLIEKNPQLKELTVRFQEHESWCLEWFCHYTYNNHLSDIDLIRSFEDFVMRKMRQNVENGHGEVNANYTDGMLPFYCLMGAEDRWRWSEPCHCDGCTKAGVVRITH